MTGVIRPPTRPEMTREAAFALLRAYGVRGPALLGRRGYYRDTMGRPGVQERGIYDDALFLVTPETFIAFNANTDPSVARPRIAVLQPGVWDYQIGTHNISKDPATHPHYTALVQAGPVTIARDGAGKETGWFGINVHKGGYNTTSSEGCQTVYPDQWMEFITAVQREMRANHIARIPYVLTERSDDD